MDHQNQFPQACHLQSAQEVRVYCQQAGMMIHRQSVYQKMHNESLQKVLGVACQRRQPFQSLAVHGRVIVYQVWHDAERPHEAHHLPAIS